MSFYRDGLQWHAVTSNMKLNCVSQISSYHLVKE